MEILHEYSTVSDVKVLLVMLLVVVAIIGFVGIYGIGSRKFTAIYLFVTTAVITSFIMFYNLERVEYIKAKVTDWNEVYDKCYETFNQEGEIVTLKKDNNCEK